MSVTDGHLTGKTGLADDPCDSPEYDETASLARPSALANSLFGPARVQLQVCNGTVRILRKNAVIYSVPAHAFAAVDVDRWMHIDWKICIDGDWTPFSFARSSSRYAAYDGVMNRDKFLAVMQTYAPAQLPESPSGGSLNAEEITSQQRHANSFERWVFVGVGAMFLVLWLVSRFVHH